MKIQQTILELNQWLHCSMMHICNTRSQWVLQNINHIKFHKILHRDKFKNWIPLQHMLSSEFYQIFTSQIVLRKNFPDFDPSMDKELHPWKTMGWNYLSNSQTWEWKTNFIPHFSSCFYFSVGDLLRVRSIVNWFRLTISNNVSPSFGGLSYLAFLSKKQC